MKTTETSYSIRPQSIIRILLGTVLILLIPLIAMQFTDEVNWTAGDFVVAGGLLLGVGFAYELVVKRVQGKYRRLVLGGLIMLVFLYIWAELAVGVFTNLGS